MQPTVLRFACVAQAFDTSVSRLGNIGVLFLTTNRRVSHQPATSNSLLSSRRAVKSDAALRRRPDLAGSNIIRHVQCMTRVFMCFTESFSVQLLMHQAGPRAYAILAFEGLLF